MILKWIVCDVPAAQREPFDDAQRVWKTLESVAGFRGQLGGWDTKSPAACILGLWDTRRAYADFMENVHDTVIADSRQQTTYVSSEVALANVELEMLDGAVPIAQRIHDAGFLRVADCQVHPDRLAHFVEVQRDVWAPGMKSSQGMLGGWFNRVPDSSRFLVTTLWRDEQCHASYVAGPFAALRERADASRDLASISGYGVLLKDTWKVVPPQ